MFPPSVPQVVNFEALPNSSSEVQGTIKLQEPILVTNLKYTFTLAFLPSLLYCLQSLSLSLWAHFPNKYSACK